MLTERAKITIVALFIALVIAFYTQVELVFYVAGLLTSLLVVSYLLFKVTSIDEAECTRDSAAAVYQGELLKVTLRLENKSRFSSYFAYLVDHFGAEFPHRRQKRLLFPYVGKRSVSVNTYEGYCAKRGIFWVGPLALVVSDPLGFFTRTTVMNVTSKLTVYPRVFPINELSTFNKGVVAPRYGSHSTRQSGDYEEFFGIREYHQEDGLRKIHWPSSAKHGSLMVRHFEQTGAQSVTIILDLAYDSNIGSDPETTLEYAVRIAASLAKYFLNQHFLVQLLAYSDKPIITSFGKDSFHFSHILELLAEATPTSSVGLAEALSKLDPFIYPNSVLAVVRLDKDYEAARAIEQLIYAKGMSVYDVQLVASSFDRRIPPIEPYQMEAKGSEIITYTVGCGEDPEYIFIRR